MSKTEKILVTGFQKKTIEWEGLLYSEPARPQSCAQSRPGRRAVYRTGPAGCLCSEPAQLYLIKPMSAPWKDVQWQARISFGIQIWLREDKP